MASAFYSESIIVSWHLLSTRSAFRHLQFNGAQVLPYLLLLWSVDCMRILIWLIRIVLFALFLFLAVANTQHATLHFTAGMAWEAPLILLGFAFFAAGLPAGPLLTLLQS